MAQLKSINAESFTLIVQQDFLKAQEIKEAQQVNTPRLTADNHSSVMFAFMDAHTSRGDILYYDFFIGHANLIVDSSRFDFSKYQSGYAISIGAMKGNTAYNFFDGSSASAYTIGAVNAEPAKSRIDDGAKLGLLRTRASSSQKKCCSSSSQSIC